MTDDIATTMDEVTATVTSPSPDLVPDDQLPADAADGVSPDEDSAKSDEVPADAQ